MGEHPGMGPPSPPAGEVSSGDVGWPKPPQSPPPAAQDEQSDEQPVCEVGASLPCTCPDGSQGHAYCISPNGSSSDCGCGAADGPDVLVPPEPMVPVFCGDTQCAPMHEEQTEVSARHCCTDDGRCGGSSSFVFGLACVERGTDPGISHESCPDENPSFLDLDGCRPRWSMRFVGRLHSNFDTGCIERSAMAKLLNDGAGERFLLSLVTFVPYEEASFEAMPCR